MTDYQKMLANFAKNRNAKTKKAADKKTAPSMLYITGEAGMILLSWLVEQFTEHVTERGNATVYSDENGSIKIWENPTKNGTFFGASDPAGDSGKKQFLWFYANSSELTDKEPFAQVRPEVFEPWAEYFAEDFGVGFVQFCADNAKPKSVPKVSAHDKTKAVAKSRKTEPAGKNKTRTAKAKPATEEPATPEEPVTPAKRRTRRTTASKGAKLA